jgi:hypothetical protein
MFLTEWEIERYNFYDVHFHGEVKGCTVVKKVIYQDGAHDPIQGLYCEKHKVDLYRAPKGGHEFNQEYYDDPKVWKKIR